MVEDTSLENLLEKYSETDIYPFHMPGHKRRMHLPAGRNLDITEIDGFDDLHHPTGVLLRAEQNAARVRGAKEAYFLVNGTTCGILSSIFAAAEPGDTIAIARNCHRSVYHAALIRRLKCLYLYPKETKMGINGSVELSEAEALFKKHPEIKALVVTSPTYDGVISDVENLAKIAHKYGAALIVDSAHGAHLGISNLLPDKAVSADYIIESLHKTLPSYTQSALLLCNAKSSDKLRKYLRIFMTSSPSYLFTASIDSCIRYIEKDGKKDIENLVNNIKDFLDETKDLKRLHVIKKEDLAGVYDYDITKILISTAATDIDGKKLSEILLKEYKIQLEMAAGNYAIALSSVGDEKAGFKRLAAALKSIDETIGEGKDVFSKKLPEPNKKLEIYEADEAGREKISLSGAEGRTSAEFVYVYPPGIPIVVPGEVIEKEQIEAIENARNIGLDIQGPDDISAEFIRVI